MSEALRFEVHGRTDGNAQTVLLSSGLGGLGAYWAPQMAVLTERYRVITYDQRGTGRNAQALPEDHAIGDMADDVAGIIRDVGAGPCHVVGHALGGLIGLELAWRFPSLVASLVPINAWARLDAHTKRCFAVRTGILRDSGVAAYLQAQPIFLHPAPWLSEHAERLAREEAAAVGHFQGAETLLRRIAALSRFDVSGRLERIATRTLVVGTRDDMLVPWTCSQTLASLLPSATLAMFETGGHASNVSDPEPFNRALVDFLG